MAGVKKMIKSNSVILIINTFVNNYLNFREERKKNEIKKDLADKKSVR